MISTGYKKNVLFVHQNSKTRKNDNKIIFRFKNILLKYKIRIEFYIPEMVKLLNNFS